jgi:hypothetical protein
MLMNYETLIMRRFMRRIAKKAIHLKTGLNIIRSTNKASQKGMVYDTLFCLFLSFHKGAFLRFNYFLMVTVISSG